MQKIKNKRIMIIGGTGSIGQVLTSRLNTDNEIFIVSRDETKQWFMQNKCIDLKIDYRICDIRDFAAVCGALHAIKPEIVINASAIKQVPTCELFPFESVKTNVLGI